MSKVISVVHRGSFDKQRSFQLLEESMRAITPDIMRGRVQTALHCEGRHLQATLDFPGHFPRHGLSLCQGKFLDAPETWAETWHVPQSPAPDGCYALIREDARFVEALSDTAANRTLWIHFDEDLFAVSNSQRAITLYTGLFAFNPDVVPWMLSTGSLGPGHSNNRHLSALPPAGSVLLDKEAWTLRHQAAPIRFEPVARDWQAHKAAMEAALRDTLGAFDARDAEHASLSLSGGVDSRIIAQLLPETPGGWSSFSAGPAGVETVPGNDAFIAAEVARACGIDHRFIPLALFEEPLETMVARFILCGEGRIDHAIGYMNRMAHLAALCAAGTQVVLRGDEGFGSKTADTPLAVRATVDVLLCGDLTGLGARLDAFSLEHRLPESLERAEGESLATWRDRLYHEFRLVAVHAALTELKASFVDILNPLLSGRALAVARGLPDALRTEKALFRELVHDLAPALPFARDNKGGLTFVDLLRRPEMRRLLEASLASDTARSCFGRPLLDWLGAEIRRVDRPSARIARAPNPS